MGKGICIPLDKTLTVRREMFVNGHDFENTDYREQIERFIKNAVLENIKDHIVITAKPEDGGYNLSAEIRAVNGCDLKPRRFDLNDPNEQMATEIAKNAAREYECWGETPVNGLSQKVRRESFEECRMSAIDAMEWKQEQFIEWLWGNFTLHPHDNSVIQGDFDKHFESFDDFIDYVKKDLNK